MSNEEQTSESVEQLGELMAQETHTSDINGGGLHFLDDADEVPAGKSVPPPLDLDDRQEVPDREPDGPGEPHKEEPASENRLSPETTADIGIGALDLLQTQLLKALILYKAKQRIGDKEAYEKALTLLDKINEDGSNIGAFPISDQAYIRIMRRAVEKIDGLPFASDEWDRMHEALVLIIKDMPEYQMPPSMGFALAIGQVMIPRMIDVLAED